MMMRTLAMAAVPLLLSAADWARRVDGGNYASAYDYPHVVLLVSDTAPPRICSGSLVNNERWILTAAHCVDGLEPGELVIAHGYPLFTEIRGVTRIEMPDGYDPIDRPAGWAHDLALVRLERPFASRAARTIRMAGAAEGLLLAQPGLEVSIAGWGRDSGSDGQAEAQAQHMTAAKRTLVACSEIPEWAVCTESETVSPTVQTGDSGGPVMADYPELDESGIPVTVPVLIAVSSWREPGTRARAREPGTVGEIRGRSRYVRVAEHREWIDAVMNSEPPESSAEACPVPATVVAPPPPPD